MANTTNYNWETPDDTDLVKDGAAAIRTLGNSVDTTTKALNPETTLGDIAYRSATSNTNTRLPIGSAGQVLTVAAGVPSWASPSDQTPLTTKGDLFTFSTVDARLGVGANGTVLTADSAETTGLKWAAPAGGGDFVKISATTFSSAASHSVDNCFSATYKYYRVLYDLTATNSTELLLRLRASSSDTSTNYDGVILIGYSSTAANETNPNGTDEFRFGGNGTGSQLIAGNLDFYNPNLASATGILGTSIGRTSTNRMVIVSSGLQTDSTQFDGFTIYCAAGTITGSIKVYGYAN
jgi:hypothetical protein